MSAQLRIVPGSFQTKTCPYSSDLICTLIFIYTANVAVNKNATQSGTFKNWVAGKAVDGITNPKIPNMSCSQTDGLRAYGSAWWQVDLAGIFNIKAVKVYNRWDCCHGMYSTSKQWKSTTTGNVVMVRNKPQRCQSLQPVRAPCYQYWRKKHLTSLGVRAFHCYSHYQ